MAVAANAAEYAVHGHRLWLDCQGQQSAPTVILIAGGGGTTATWDKVQPEVARFARVCSYDRAGLGKSSADRESQSANGIADDLEALLKKARVHPPYVVVGHSIGGLYARRFDERHDREVAGMVLLDSSHEEQIWRFAESEPEALKEYPQWRDAAAMSAQGFLPPGKHLTWKFKKPLIVIEHGIPPEPVWHLMQEDLASRSLKSEFLTATGSSHYIQKIQPVLVIKSIRSVIAKCQEGKW